MNSLNLISSRVIGQSQQPSRSRSRSQGERLKNEYDDDDSVRGRSYSDHEAPSTKKEADAVFPDLLSAEPGADDDDIPIKDEDEKQPLLGFGEKGNGLASSTGWRGLVQRLADAITAILAAIGAPVVYIAKCFRDQEGRFSLVPHWPRRERVLNRSSTHATDRSSESQEGTWNSEKPANRALLETKLRQSYSSDSLHNSTSESDSELRKAEQATQRTKPEAREECARGLGGTKIVHQNQGADRGGAQETQAKEGWQPSW